MSTAFMRKPYRSNKRFGAIVALVLALALAVIAPPVGQAAEVAPSVVGTRVEFGPGGGMVWADVESPPAGYPVSGHPSTINISGQTGTIASLSVTLTGLNHPRPDDWDILLEGPTGIAILLMADVCDGVDAPSSITFQDGAPAAPDDSGCGSGPYAPTIGTGAAANHVDDNRPGGVDPTTTLLSTFNGTDPNGTWTLYALDDRNGSGRAAEIGGWTLDITLTATNTPPIIDPIDDQFKNVGEVWTITTNVTDPDTGDTLSYSLMSSVPGVVDAIIDDEGIIDLQALAPGTTMITVTVSDGVNAPVQTIFNVTVLGEGEPTPEPTVEPTVEPTEPPVIYTEEDHRRAQAPLCMDLSGQTNPAVRAAVPGDAVPGGNVYCRVLAQDGVFPNPNDPGRVGDPGLIAYGVITAVDIFGVTGDGMAYPGFNHAVTVCLEGSGRFIFLSALNSPRTTYEVPSVADGGYTCGSIPAAGTVVLIPFAPQN